MVFSFFFAIFQQKADILVLRPIKLQREIISPDASFEKQGLQFGQFKSGWNKDKQQQRKAYTKCPDKYNDFSRYRPQNSAGVFYFDDLPFLFITFFFIAVVALPFPTS